MSTKKEKPTSTTTQTSDVAEVDTGLIVQLSPTLQRFVHLYTTGQYTNAKLAQLLNVHPNTILNWLKRKDVKEVIADLQETTHMQVSQQLKNLTIKATNKLNDLIDSPIDGVALQAVKDILDRAGHKPKTETKKEVNITHTFEEKLNKLIEDTIIDADFEEVEDVDE